MHYYKISFGNNFSVNISIVVTAIKSNLAVFKVVVVCFELHF